MTITKADVMSYLTTLTTRTDHRFLIGQLTGWPGSEAPDQEIPSIASTTGHTPAMVADVFGELGHAEDHAHWTAGDNLDIATEIPDAIAGLKAYWDAGSLVRINYLPASLVGPTTASGFLTTMNLTDGGRHDPTSPPTYPMIVTDLATTSGPTTCAQWQQGTLVTGLRYTDVLDYHAAYLKQLHDHGVVSIFSPWNEFDTALKGATNRSWWNLSAADFITLWRFVYDYFTTTKGLTSLIWLWDLLEGTSAGSGGRAGMTYYPGDAYVDLVGWNHYVTDGLAPSVPAYAALVDTGKPIMFGEIGLQDAPSDPKDLNAFIESVKANMPLIIGGMFWSGIWSINADSNTTAGMTNTWAVVQPVPVAPSPPTASFTTAQPANTLDIDYTDTSA